MVTTASEEGMASYARTWACGQVSGELGRDRRRDKGATGPLRHHVVSLNMGDGGEIFTRARLAYSSVLTLTINKVTCCWSSSYTDDIINPVSNLPEEYRAACYHSILLSAKKQTGTQVPAIP